MKKYIFDVFYKYNGGDGRIDIISNKKRLALREVERKIMEDFSYHTVLVTNYIFRRVTFK